MSDPYRTSAPNPHFFTPIGNYVNLAEIVYLWEEGDGYRMVLRGAMYSTYNRATGKMILTALTTYRKEIARLQNGL